MLPNILIRRQKALGHGSVDLNIMMDLPSYWWAAEKLLFTSKRVSNDRSKPNQYDFTDLIDAAKPYALQELQSAEAERDERAQRSARKGNYVGPPAALRLRQGLTKYLREVELDGAVAAAHAL